MSDSVVTFWLGLVSKWNRNLRNFDGMNALLEDCYSFAASVLYATQIFGDNKYVLFEFS